MSNTTLPAGCDLYKAVNSKIHCQSYDSSQKVRNYGFNKVSVFFRKNSDAGLFGTGQEMILPQFCVDEVNEFYWYVDTNFNSTAFLLLTILVLAVLMCINYKTWHPYRLDFYKSINYYILGTLAFGVGLQVSRGLGFTRPVAVGVLLHNTAEFFILKKLWFGKYGVASYVILTGAIYQIFFLVSILWMPIVYLYLFAMFQGATMDFSLVFTYGIVAHLYTDFRSKKWKWNCQAWIAGCVAAIVHISTIIPMFFGLELGRSPLVFSATAGLAATFMMYELYLACRYGRITCCDPSYTADIKLTLNIASSATMSKKLHLLGALDNIGSTGGDIDTELNTIVNKVNKKKRQINENNDENKDNNDNDNVDLVVDQPKPGSHQAVTDDIDNLFKTTQVGLRNNLFDNITIQNIKLENELTEAGILIQFCGASQEQDMCDCKKVYCFWITTVIGAITSLGWSLFVWFSPAIWEGRCRK